MSTSSVLKEVKAERARQDAKQGQQNHEPVKYFAILSEEFGEVAKEVVEYTFAVSKEGQLTRMKNMREELVQTAAVAVAMIESLDRNELL